MSAPSLRGLQPNEQITPSLCLVRPLAVGGMASVWIARHQGLQTEVVVKFILAELADEPEVIARFQREASAASDVKSPHVVQMLDHGLTDRGLPFIAMELLEGEDLDARIQRERVLPPTEVAGIVLQVSRALARAHEKKIVHRDIKPENIFLCETGEDDAFVKVLDFGIAKVSTLEQQHTLTGEMIGSPLWMSPEQVMGLKSIDHRSDLWSLGVVAFYALTGVLPFGGASIGAISTAICVDGLPVPSRSNYELSPEIDEWFARACAREVTGRFQTARAMADALVALVGGPALARVRSKEAPSMGSMPTRALPRPSLPPPQLVASVPPPRVDVPLQHIASPSSPAARAKPLILRRPRRTLWLAGGGVMLLAGVCVGLVLSRERTPEPAPVAEAASSPSATSPPQATSAEPPDAAIADAHARPVTKPRVPPKPKPKPTVPSPKTTKPSGKSF